MTSRRFRALMLTAAFALRPVAAAAAIVLVSVPEEIAMGRQAQSAMAARTPRVASAEVQEYVSQIGRRLAASAGGPAFSYSFDVANLAEVNALALPGGHIWVYRGALAIARSESELAGVLAHEVAHVVERHAARQASAAMVASIGLQLLSALLGNTGGAVTSGLAANALTGSVFLGFSREDELVADVEGTRILRKAGGILQGWRRSSRPRAQRRDKILQRSTCSSRRIRRRTIASRRFDTRTRRTGACGATVRRLRR